jgi:hypothetical protein
MSEYGSSKMRSATTARMPQSSKARTTVPTSSSEKPCSGKWSMTAVVPDFSICRQPRTALA